MKKGRRNGNDKTCIRCLRQVAYSALPFFCFVHVKFGIAWHATCSVGLVSADAVDVIVLLLLLLLPRGTCHPKFAVTLQLFFTPRVLVLLRRGKARQSQ